MDAYEYNYEFLSKNGFEDADKPGFVRIPEGFVAASFRPEAKDHTALMGITVSPVVFNKDNGGTLYIYRLGKNLIPKADALSIADAKILKPGNSFKVPTVVKGEMLKFSTITNACVLCDFTPNTFDKFAIDRVDSEMLRRANDARPLLGDICHAGRYTVWYAAPGTGKSLLAVKLALSAIQEGRIPAQRIYYINSDESVADAAAKIELFAEYGAHTLISGEKGFKNADLPDILEEMIRKGELDGTLIILDTLKKFSNIMDKAKMSAFNDILRRVTLAGGTVLALAHTNKAKDANGRSIHAGTTDTVEDTDAAYIFDLVPDPDKTHQKIRIQSLKLRGAGARNVYCTYSNEENLSYDQRVASVSFTDDGEYYGEVDSTPDEQEIIDAILNAIDEGVVTKMALSHHVAAQLNVSGRSVLRTLAAYAGTNPKVHFWSTRRGPNGGWVHSRLDRSTDGATG